MARTGRSFPYQPHRPFVQTLVVQAEGLAPPFDPSAGAAAWMGSDVTGQDAVPTGYTPWYDPTPDACAVVLDTLPAQPGALTVSVRLWFYHITWFADPGATSYNLYRARTASASRSFVANVTGTSYDDHGADQNSLWNYWLEPVDAFGVGPVAGPALLGQELVGEAFLSWDGSLDAWQPDSGYAPWVDQSDLDACSIALDTLPTQVTFASSNANSPWFVTVNWSGATNATSYNVYRAQTGGPNSPVARAFLGNTTGSSWDDHSIYGAGVNTYIFRFYIEPVNAFGTGPIFFTSETNPNPAGGFLDWDGSLDAWQADSGFARWVDTSHVEAQDPIVLDTLPGATGTPSATAAPWFIHVSWSAATNATSYNVYRATGSGSPGPFALYATTAATSFDDHAVVAAAPGGFNNYFYYIEPVNSFGTGPVSAQASNQLLVAGAFLDWDGSLDRWSDERLYAPDTGAEYVRFIFVSPVFNPANGFDWTDGSGQQDQSNYPQWYDPTVDTQARVDLPNATLDPFPLKQVDDLNEQVDRTITWPTWETSGEYVSPANPGGATVAQYPLWSWTAEQDVDLTILWYAETEQAWGFPDAYFPVIVPGDLGGLFSWDAQADVDRTQVWPTYETGAELDPYPRPGFTPANVDYTDNSDQQDLDRTVVWYQPDTGAEWTPLPSVTQDANPLKQVDSPDEQVSREQVWPTVETSAEWVPIPGLREAATGQEPLWGWEATQDVDLTVVWPTWETSGEWVPLPTVTQATVDQASGNYGWDAQSDVDRSIVWPTVDTGAEWVPTPSIGNEPSAAQQAGLNQQPGEDEQLDRTICWPTWETSGEFVPAIGLGSATTPQFPIQQPSADEDADRTTRWYQEPDDTLGIPPFAPSTATVAQQAGLYNWDGLLDVDITQTWFAPDEAVWTPTPSVTQATVAQDAGLWHDDPTDYADRSQTWPTVDTGAEWVRFISTTPVFNPGNGYDWSEQPAFWTDQTWFAPEEAAWVPVPGLTQDAFPLKQVDSPDEQADRTQVWPTYDTGAEWVPLPSIGNAATVAQYPLYGYEALTDVDLTVTWFAPDEQAWVPLPTVTVDPVPLKQVDSPDEQVDRSVLWFQDEHLAWVPGLPEQPQTFGWLQVADDSEQADRTQTWFQDEHLAWVPVPNLSTPTQFGWLQVAGDDEQLDRTQLWFAPDEQAPYLTPPFAPSTATVPQEALWGWVDPQEVDLTQTWPTVDTGSEWTFQKPPYTPPTIDQLGGIWQEQPYPEAGTAQQWFAPDISVEGLVPVKSATSANVPLYGWVDPQEVDLTIVWFAPDASVEGFRPLANAPTHPDYGWDAGQDVDLTICWPTWETSGEWVPLPYLTLDPYPLKQQAGDDEQVSREVLWFQDEHVAWLPLPFEPSEPTTFAWQQVADDSEQRDQTIVWFAPEADEHNLDVFLYTPPTTAMFPIQVAGDDEQVSRDICWPTVDTGGEFIALPRITEATVAQDAGLWPENPAEQVDLSITWPTYETSAEWVPTPSVTEATVAQQAGLYNWDALLDRDLTVVWPTYETGAEYVSPANPGGATVAQEPIQQPSADEDVSRDVVWFQTDTENLVLVPSIAVIVPPLPQVDDPSEQTSRDVVWFAPEPESNGPEFQFYIPATPATAAGLYSWDAQFDRDLSVTWFAPEHDPVLGLPPFAPSFATVAQQAAALQAYEAVEQRDLTITWYQEPDDTVSLTPVLTVSPALVTASDAGAMLVTPSDASGNVVSASDASGNTVSPSDASGNMVSASDAPATIITASDTG